MATTDDILARAAAAMGRGEWTGARDLYAQALEREERAEARDGLGLAWWFLGERTRAIEERRRAYARYRRDGDAGAAARLAVYLGAEARIDGNGSAANGWLARAETLLEGHEPCSAHGWLAVERAKRADDPAVKQAQAQRAVDLGRALGDADVEIMGLAQLGVALVRQGEVARGVATLDEAMAAAMGGEGEDPLAIGDACCQTLLACDRLDDVRRSADWCQEVVGFIRRNNYTPLTAWCRTVYAGVLVGTGAWAEAEAELLAACATYDELGSTGRVLALARLADLRVRQGRLEEAEHLVAGLEEHPLAVPVVVGLAMRRGDLVTAGALAERHLVAVSEDPGLRGSALVLLADVRLAEGSLETAARAIAELAAIGQATSSARLRALARDREARVAVAQHEADLAATAFAEAAAAFEALSMPLEQGRALLGLARLHAEAGSPLAVTVGRRARGVFEGLGAARDADEAAAFLRSEGVAGRSPGAARGSHADLTAREREVLELMAAGLGNAEIARRLVISPKTAEHHAGRVLRKLGLRSRAEAAAALARAGPAPP